MVLKGCLGRRMLSSFNWLCLLLRHCQVLKRANLTWDLSLGCDCWSLGVGRMDPLMLCGASGSVSFDWGTISVTHVSDGVDSKENISKTILPPPSFSRYFTFCLVVLKLKGLHSFFPPPLHSSRIKWEPNDFFEQDLWKWANQDFAYCN